MCKHKTRCGKGRGGGGVVSSNRAEGKKHGHSLFPFGLGTATTNIFCWERYLRNLRQGASPWFADSFMAKKKVTLKRTSNKIYLADGPPILKLFFSEATPLQQ